MPKDTRDLENSDLSRQAKRIVFEGITKIGPALEVTSDLSPTPLRNLKLELIRWRKTDLQSWDVIELRNEQHS